MENLAARLEGELVVLEPFTEAHADELWPAAQAREIWQWLPHLGEDREKFGRWFELMSETMAAGGGASYAVRRRADGVLIGSSSYMNVRAADRVLEIGSTWFNPSAWRTGVNLETKLLLIGHAFDALGCVRVEFKTDARNERSRNALAALPARFEGVMRNHMIVPDVGQRDSAYFSVIPEEWPEVRANLERRLRR